MKKIEEQPHTPFVMHRYGFEKAVRCNAKTRRGTFCQAPAAHGKGRCRMHGGAKGSGAPRGNKNALKHGFYSKELKQTRKFIQTFIKQSYN